MVDVNRQIELHKELVIKKVKYYKLLLRKNKILKIKENIKKKS